MDVIQKIKKYIKDNTTIRNKFRTLGIFIILFFIGLTGLAFHHLLLIEEDAQILMPISRLYQKVSRANEIEKKFMLYEPNNIIFFETGKSQIVDENNEIFTEISNHIKKIKKNKALQEHCNSLLNEEFKNLYLAIEKQENLFNNLVTSIKARGYMVYGLAGRWQETGKQLRKTAKEFNDILLDKILNNLLQYEDQYLLRKEPILIKKVNELSQNYQKQLLSPAILRYIPATVKSQLAAEINQYSVYGQELLLIDKKIGFNFSEGIWHDVQNNIQIIEKSIIDISEHIKAISKKEIKNAKRSLLILSFILTIVLVFFLLIITRSVLNPISEIKKYISKLSRGKIPKRVDINNKDEISQMFLLLNNFVNSLKEKTNFASSIGKGNFSHSFKSLSKNDKLGLALIEMKKNLKKAKEEEEIRKQEEKINNWVTNGLTKFNDILRKDAENHEALAQEIIAELVNYLEANQAGLFIINDNDIEDVFIEMISSFAYDSQRITEKRMELNEGLIGRSITEKNSLYLKEIPENYINITSGLGDANPKVLLITPMKLNEQIFGIIEIASFNEIEKYQIKFVEKVAENIASALNKVKIKAHTETLLNKSQMQAEELAAQEEEMRQNLEELQTTQEDATKRESEIRGQIEAINRTNAFAEFDTYGKLQKVNDIFCKMFGYSNEDQVIGKHHSIFVDESEKKTMNYKNFWQDLQHGISKQGDFKRVMKNGKRVYIRGVYNPVLDNDGEVIKVIKLASNITEQKQQQSKTNSILQAIDHIVIRGEYNIDGTIIYTNTKYIENFAIGMQDLKGKNIRIFIPEEEKEEFNKIWTKLKKGIFYEGFAIRQNNKGEEVKLYMTYTPIRNNLGEIDRVLLLANIIKSEEA